MVCAPVRGSSLRTGAQTLLYLTYSKEKFEFFFSIFSISGYLSLPDFDSFGTMHSVHAPSEIQELLERLCKYIVFVELTKDARQGHWYDNAYYCPSGQVETTVAQRVKRWPSDLAIPALRLARSGSLFSRQRHSTQPFITTLRSS